jgi:hypothetical protein
MIQKFLILKTMNKKKTKRKCTCHCYQGACPVHGCEAPYQCHHLDKLEIYEIPVVVKNS